MSKSDSLTVTLPLSEVIAVYEHFSSLTGLFGSMADLSVENDCAIANLLDNLYSQQGEAMASLALLIPDTSVDKTEWGGFQDREAFVNTLINQA